MYNPGGRICIKHKGLNISEFIMADMASDMGHAWGETEKLSVWILLVKSSVRNLLPTSQKYGKAKPETITSGHKLVN